MLVFIIFIIGRVTTFPYSIVYTKLKIKIFSLLPSVKLIIFFFILKTYPKLYKGDVYSNRNSVLLNSGVYGWIIFVDPIFHFHLVVANCIRH